jgi:predicted DNA-binding transcriptional regulator YafY
MRQLTLSSSPKQTSTPTRAIFRLFSTTPNSLKKIRLFCGIPSYTGLEEVNTMPKSDGYHIADRLQKIQIFFWQNKEKRITTKEVAERFGVSEDVAYRDLDTLSDNSHESHELPRLPLAKEGKYWFLPASARFEPLPLHLDLSETTALYLAARLLLQIQDERNAHMLAALTKLVSIMPRQAAVSLTTLLNITVERHQKQPDRSSIFETLALGWLTHNTVRLLYAPPKKRKFECTFCPYLLEPSGIGRTIYALGYSTPPGDLRTFKLERIEFAELTGTHFTIPEDFNGPEKLKHAWGIMYGDEQPIEVRLRFSHYVAGRVEETIWHPSQKTTYTPEGLVWVAQIGDTLEIENWIRGWGSDCEVLAPLTLRETILDDLRRSAHLYGLSRETAAEPFSPHEEGEPSENDDDPDNGLLQGLL